jgi:hypothetical protein
MVVRSPLLYSEPQLMEGALSAIEKVLGRRFSHVPLEQILAGRGAKPGKRKDLSATVRKGMAGPGILPHLFMREGTVSSLWTQMTGGCGRLWQMEFRMDVAAEVATTEVGVELLMKVCEALVAPWGTLDPPESSALTRRLLQTPLPARLRRAGIRQPPGPAGLPRLTAGNWLKKHPPEMPEWLGWINWWSDHAATAAGLEVNTARAKGRGLSKIEDHEAGWFLQITDEPLDPNRRKHVQQLALAYQRFPRVGRPYRGAPASGPNRTGAMPDWLVATRQPP